MRSRSASLTRSLGDLGRLFTERENLPEQLVIYGITVYAVVFTLYGAAKYEFFRTGFFDFGLQIQQAWLVSHGLFTSYALNRPIMVIAGGLFSVYPHAVTLLAFQSFMLALGAVPLYLLARKELDRKWISVGFAFAYLLHPALQGINQYEFHDLAFGVPFILFAYYFRSTGKSKAFIVSILLSLFCNEFYVVVVGFMGVSFLLEFFLRREHESIVYMALCGALSLGWVAYLQVSFMIPHFGLSTLPSGGYTITGSSQFLNIGAVLDAPVLALTTDWTSKLTYLVYLFAPVLFLPVLSLRSFLPSLPWLSVVALYSPPLAAGGIGTVFGLWTQWSSFLVPFVFVSAVYGMKRLHEHPFSLPKGRQNQIAVGILLATLVVSFSTGAFSPISVPFELSVGDSTVPTAVAGTSMFHGVWPTPTVDSQLLDSVLSQIPPNMSVLTQNVVGSKLAERAAPVVVFFQPGYQTTEADAIVLDYGLSGICGPCVSALLSTGDYRTVLTYPNAGIYLYFKT